MQYRVLKAASLVAALVPTLAIAQQRPATPPATPPATAPRPTTPPATTPPAQQPRPATAAAPAAAAVPAGPHRDNAWEFTIQGAMFSVDQAFGGFLNTAAGNNIFTSNDQFMYGGHAQLTKNLSSHLGLGIGAGYATGNGATSIQPTLDLTWTSNINKKFNVFIPIGVDFARFSGNSTRVTSTYGFHGGLGVRYGALRVEGRMSYQNFDESSDPVYNGQARAGLSFFFGGAPPKDTDMDGVPDKKDRCAATPRGAVVDVNGCPRDTDRDGVFDGLDRCANTPANTPVDATGCPRDTDRDGVTDNLDRCPNTPAGTAVDANGCPRDADGDGVADAADRCANTPRGTPVDANGCPRDADGDGVQDAADRCPNTPAGTPVDANGCPRDTDGDGVADNADRCANTPAGTRVDANGCPLAPDADRDGVEDSRDRCPNTPITSGRSVDANGCYLAELPAVGASLVIRNINFASGTARLTPASAQTLRDIGLSIRAMMAQSPTAHFEVNGYTDNRGSPASNRRLSQGRAESVMAALITAGVPASALTAVGRGPDNPKAPNTTAAGRAQNRRVEIKRLN